jgi:hypothetical protein
MNNQCSKCKKTYSTKYNLAKHINTNICDKILMRIKDRTCVKCHRIFSSVQSLLCHDARGCKNIVKFIKSDLENNYDNQSDIIKKELEEMKLKIAKLENSNNSIVNSNNNNNITNNTTNNVNITITPYYKPNKYLNNEDIKKILNKGYMSVQELITRMHFNKDHPENHNVYISNKKDWMISYYNGTEWVLDPDTDIIDELYDNNSMFLIEKFGEMNPQLDSATLAKFGRFKDDSDTPKVIKDIKKDIKFILYNKRNIVAKE